MEEIPEDLKEASKFHGHLCPGLIIGYRVAKLAQKRLGLGHSEDEELVAIVENNSCAVDAIQYINGTTFGKGNLIFQDHGLHAYTFIERTSGKQIRIELKADLFYEGSLERQKIREKMQQNLPLTADEKAMMRKARQEMTQKMLSLPDQDIFNVKEVRINVPEKANIFRSVKCSKCGLMVMETRARLLNSKLYCIPCWENELVKE
ncbi:MAG: FmdE family protein [Candidatus Helarchaeota archaeon]